MKKYRVVFLAGDSLVERETNSPYALDHVIFFPSIKSPGDMVIVRSCKTNLCVDAVAYDGEAWKQVV